MSELDRSCYIRFLKGVLSPNRFQHSLGVMQMMGELAEIYALDQERALTAGLLHDAAKELNSNQIEEIVQEAKIEFYDPCERDYVLYLHGPVSAFYACKELGVTDSIILGAICRHTWFGKIETFESPLVWCLRFSDILELNRKWDSAAHRIQETETHLRECVFAGKLEEAAFIQTDMLIKFYEETGKPVHPNFYRVYNDLSIRLHRPIRNF